MFLFFVCINGRVDVNAGRPGALNIEIEELHVKCPKIKLMSGQNWSFLFPTDTIQYDKMCQ